MELWSQQWARLFEEPAPVMDEPRRSTTSWIGLTPEQRRERWRERKRAQRANPEFVAGERQEHNERNREASRRRSEARAAARERCLAYHGAIDVAVRAVARSAYVERQRVAARERQRRIRAEIYADAARHAEKRLHDAELQRRSRERRAA